MTLVQQGVSIKGQRKGTNWEAQSGDLFWCWEVIGEFMDIREGSVVSGKELVGGLMKSE